MTRTRTPRMPAALIARILMGAIFFILVAQANLAGAQAAESADAGRAMFSVGGGFSAYRIQYGQRNLLGPTLWIDANSIRPLGFQGEVRRLDWHQQSDVHAETYLAGLRYRFHVRGTQPYVKALVGDGHFNFPYNFATGNYLVIAPGGGLDYALGGHWSARADFEYQYWSEFTYGNMSAAGATVGIRCRIF